MAHGDALPEQSTTLAEREQWDHDHAIRAKLRSVYVNADKIAKGSNQLTELGREYFVTLRQLEHAIQMEMPNSSQKRLPK